MILCKIDAQLNREISLGSLLKVYLYYRLTSEACERDLQEVTELRAESLCKLVICMRKRFLTIVM